MLAEDMGLPWGSVTVPLMSLFCADNIEGSEKMHSSTAAKSLSFLMFVNLWIDCFGFYFMNGPLRQMPAVALLNRYADHIRFLQPAWHEEGRKTCPEERW